MQTYQAISTVPGSAGLLRSFMAGVSTTALLFLLQVHPAPAQTEPTVGLHDKTPAVFALVDARIVTGPGAVIERGTLVIRDGLIEAVGAEVRPPADARVIDLAGSTLYAGFIDLYTHLGVGAERAGRATATAQGTAGADPSSRAPRGPSHWNPQVRADLEVERIFWPEAEPTRKLRSQGFTMAVTASPLGIFKGNAALITLGEGHPRDLVLRNGVLQNVSFEPSSELGRGYPTSFMGALALIRQTLHDSEWYLAAHAAFTGSPRGLRRPETNPALEALAPVLDGRRPLLVETGDELDLLRAAGLARRFGLDLWVKGSGYEYRRLEAVRQARPKLVLPVSFPSRPEVGSPEDALQVEFHELRHWHLAPENPARLAEGGVPFALTAHGLGDTSEFLNRLRTAVGRGLSAEAALAALTTTPAAWLGLEERYGTLEVGKAAHIVVAKGDLFGENGSVREVWIDGSRYNVQVPPEVHPKGEWELHLRLPSEITGRLIVRGANRRLRGELVVGEERIELLSVVYHPEPRRIVLRLRGEALGIPGIVTLSGSVTENTLVGLVALPDGESFPWSGRRLEAPEESASETPAEELSPLESTPLYPPLAFGRNGPPEQPEHLLIRNATLWTQGPEGIVVGGDLLVRRGRIERVGRNLATPPGALVVDAAGKHVTPGLIDPHLHSGIRGGVNETGGAVVPEVRIRDAVHTNDIWMYRQLAGGLTTAHLMHGSANPIGGQNATVKMRWGALPEEIFFEGAPRTVKFALGENVKRRRDRYPNTRMGTEQIIRDHLRAALDYTATRSRWEESREGPPPRRDLRLEALAEILEGEILIHSHCYRQDEILMLMRLMEEFGIRVHSFHHTVEAFKVAEELKRHGAGAVVWSDWLAFKIVAFDATLFNARLTHDHGVLTALHSDNSQIAARMNWEAAKVAATGMREEEALALVTLNAARILGIDDRVGSLEAGKDADFVVWSAPPLSSQAVCEQTWIDGRRYFDLEEDRRFRRRVGEERAALIQRVLQEEHRTGAPSSSGPSDAETAGGSPVPFEAHDLAGEKVR